MTAPFLVSKAAPAPQHKAAPPSLLDLMYDGFYVLFLLKNGNGPRQQDAFAQGMAEFVEEFGRNAARQGAASGDIEAAKYAFCAAIDETILGSGFPMRDDWSRRPLQLMTFGQQLAGENFFDKLESLRLRGGAHLQALEVFHMCLLLGFQGKYILEGQEKLHYLSARLGDEIAAMKGRRGGFAPHAERPDSIVNRLRNDMPLRLLAVAFLLACTLGYAGFRTSLSTASDAAMGAPAYRDVIQAAPKPAELTITLP